jgi:hypothetical protein
MGRFFSRAVQAAGAYRLVEVIYSIWSGKSLLALAMISGASALIPSLVRGISWADLDKIVLMAAAIYAVLTFGWWATISVYRKVSPRHKLAIPEFDFRCDPVTGSNPLQATAFQAVVNLKNLADFPLSYRVHQIDFRIQNTTSSGQLANQGATIDATQSGNFASGLVRFHHPITLPVQGTLNIKIFYGKDGSEKFEKEASILVSFVADSSTPTGIRHYWTYVT